MNSNLYLTFQNAIEDAQKLKRIFLKKKNKNNKTKFRVLFDTSNHKIFNTLNMKECPF